jgi:phosphatidylglycerol:prolipoprotein diacylglycerol transferase
MAITGASYVEPFYFVSVTAALGLALLFPVTRNIRPGADRRKYYFLQAVTIVGALVGAKVSALIGDYHWPMRAVDDWRIIIFSGRSITGALIGGFAAAEFAKPLIGYKLPPNDRFAAVLPFSIGIGRIGCALTGCCLGSPHSGILSVTYADGVARYPTQLFEAAFHFTIGISFIWAVKRRILFGRVFSFYLVAYGAFRFLTEFIRATPKDFGGYSAYQWFSAVMVLLGAAFLLKRTIWRPRSWSEQKFRQEAITA